MTPRVLEESHADMVSSLKKSGAAIRETLTDEKVDAWHGATGVCTEAGELLDAAKKFVVYNKPIDRENVIEELGDLEFYMEMVRQSFGITRLETLAGNMTKLSKRYKDFKYSDQQAHDRADKTGSGV